ncbi:MAG: hypothetical protein JXQ65_14380 [Candidatus Marinimicrobia bacterium]|nr:hypothetical protein [Candidatus Neomarinimicrobiota bacterium]
MNKIKIQSKSLIKSIVRDSFMVFILFIPIFVAVLFRIVMPILQGYLSGYFDLSEYYEFITIFILVMGPMMSGMVIGFNLLDDRDENILTYMAITPLRKEGYLLFKVFAPMVAVLIQSILILLIFNIGNINEYKLFPLLFLLAMETPLYALLMATFASNKVEGLAFGKLMGISLAGPFFSYFLPSLWRFTGGLFPTFWICESYFASGWMYLLFWLIGFVMHSLLLWQMNKKFLQRSN